MEQSFLEKLKVTQLLQKFPPFYGTRRFTTVSTRDRHCTLWARWIQSTSSHCNFLRLQPPIQWVPRALSPGVKLLKHEVNHSPPSTPPYVFMAWPSDNFTLPWTIGVLGFDFQRGLAYPMGTGAVSLGDKAAGAWSWPLTSI